MVGPPSKRRDRPDGSKGIAGESRHAERAKSAAPAAHPHYDSYLRLGELMDLASPYTDLPGEHLFIVFHQMAEMCFGLILGELAPLTSSEFSPPLWETGLDRIIEIYRLLVHQIIALGRCLDRDQFLIFRELLSPASGFQSFQYRKIELMSARLADLVNPERRKALPGDASAEQLFQNLYWRLAVPHGSGSDRRMITDFEARHLDALWKLAQNQVGSNLAARYAALSPESRSLPALVERLRRYDYLANHLWPNSHLRVAKHLLLGSHQPIASTGRTNWQTYLATGHRGRRFFPELHNARE